VKINNNISSRERVQRLLRDGRTDKIPKGELCINDGIICAEYGSAAFEERFAFIQSLGLDIVTLLPQYPGGMSRLPEVKEVQWPDLGRWVNNTSLFAFAVLDGAFEWGMRILGLKEFCVMLKRSPLSLQELILRVEALNGALLERLSAYGINGIILADDIAHQQGLFASSEILQKSFIPSPARQAERSLYADLPVFYHSDGNYLAVIAEIVSAGFTGLQCLEKSAGMDIQAIRGQFGSGLCLWGHLEVDSIMQAQVPGRINEIISTATSLATRGRFIMGTTSGLFEGLDIEALRTIYHSLS